MGYTTKSHHDTVREAKEGRYKITGFQRRKMDSQHIEIILINCIRRMSSSRDILQH